MKLFNTKTAKLCALALFALSAQNLLVACEPAEQKGEQKKEVIDVSKFMDLPLKVRAKMTDFIDPVKKLVKLRGLREWKKQEVGRHDDWVWSVGCSSGCSPDGNSIVSGGQDREVLVWTRKAGGLWSSQEVGMHDDWVICVCWSPDGQSIVSGGEDCKVFVWTKQDGGSWRGQEVGKHNSEVRSVGWSPDGQSIGFCGLDTTIVVYNNTYTSKNLEVVQKVLMLDVLAHVQAGKKMEFDADHVKVYHTLPEKMQQLVKPLVSGDLEPPRDQVDEDIALSGDRVCSDSKDAE